LRIVKSTPVLTPLKFEAPVDMQNILFDKINCNQDYYGVDYESEWPQTYWPEEFKDDDLIILQEVWRGISNLYNLQNWMKSVFSEKFATQIDSIASRFTDKGFSVGDLQICADELTIDKKILYELLIKHRDDVCLSLNEEERQNLYRRNFQHIFLEKCREQITNTTRLGRAVQVFKEGLHLSPLHAFISMCIVLETLFTTDSQEVSHKIAVRLANLLCKDKNPIALDWRSTIKQ